jgi:dipeptidyl aminopeptidase/acylaminoacyl peptidase
LLLDLETGKELAESWDGPGTSIIPHRFSPVEGDNRLLAHRIDRRSKRPLLWDPITKERTELSLDELEGDVSAVDWSSDGRRVLLVQEWRAQQWLYTLDLLTNRLVRLAIPSGVLSYFGSPVCYFAVPGEIWCQWQDASHPPCLIAVSDRDGSLLRTVLPSGPVPAGHAVTSIEFPSSDGQMVQGWLGVPDGPGPFPTIIEAHTGPEYAEMNAFSPQGQAWIDAGYAHLAVNYRGSASFGRPFQETIYGDVGHWEVEDIVAARNWVVARGIAQPEAVFPTGWTYGANLVLLALGKYPGLWAGGIAGYIVSDWAALYATTSDRMVAWMGAIFGGTPEEKPEVYRAASPMTYLDQIDAPVLILQPKNHTSTSPEQATLFAQRLQARGGQVEVHWTEGGHEYEPRDVETQRQALMMQFVERARKQYS